MIRPVVLFVMSLWFVLLMGTLACSGVEGIADMVEDVNVEEIKDKAEDLKNKAGDFVPSPIPADTKDVISGGSPATGLVSWIKVNTGEWEQTDESIKVYGAGYREGHQGLESKASYNFLNTGTFIEWKANGGSGNYAAFWIFLISDYDPKTGENSGRALGGFFTTDHSYKNSTVITDDTWYYTSITVDAEGNYTAVTATGNYDIEGGTIANSGTGAWENADNGKIVVIFQDNYGGTETFVEVGGVISGAVEVGTGAAATPPVPTPTTSHPACVKVTDSIAGTNQPAGVFFTNTVTLNVPDHFTSIVMARDCDGAKPIGIDDEARVTVTSPSGKQQVVTINKNDAFGKPMGEQWVLSNTVDFEPGLNQIKVELVNVYAPAGSNASSSRIYIVDRE
ncbi:MAG: hypothetical protein V3S82_10670 [Dehalococcoidia bacterium]